MLVVLYLGGSIMGDLYFLVQFSIFLNFLTMICMVFNNQKNVNNKNYTVSGFSFVNSDDYRPKPIEIWFIVTQTIVFEVF